MCQRLAKVLDVAEVVADGVLAGAQGLGRDELLLLATGRGLLGGLLGGLLPRRLGGSALRRLRLFRGGLAGPTAGRLGCLLRLVVGGRGLVLGLRLDLGALALARRTASLGLRLRLAVVGPIVLLLSGLGVGGLALASGTTALGLGRFFGLLLGRGLDDGSIVLGVGGLSTTAPATTAASTRATAASGGGVGPGAVVVGGVGGGLGFRVGIGCGEVGVRRG
ncbi:MAG: hypothetical protein ACYTG4_00515 [Planctomycetota bacterium]